MQFAYKNFTGGEINPNLSTRYDLAKFDNSLRHLENFLPELHGPLSRRMGTYFLEDLGAAAVLLPFEFSADPSQNYVIVLQEGQLRLAQRNGFVLAETGPLSLEAPYLQSQLYDISFAQSGDIVYLAHPAHRLRKLCRYSHTDWRLEEVSFIPAIAKPGGVKVVFSSTGTYPLRYKVAAVNAKGEVSQAELCRTPKGKHPSDWVQGDYATVSWNAVAGASTYNIYREEAGSFGLIGVSETLTFRDDKYTADTSDTPSEPQDPFTDGNYPSVVCFHQQRLVLGAPALQPQTWFASRTGNYEDFSKSRPIKDDDSLEFTIASGRIDRIQWAASFGDLIVGTAGSEYKAIGADQGTITPTSLNMREQSYWGSVKLKPLIIGNSILHVQRQGSRVRDLFYSLERDGYAGNDLSIMAAHLFNNYLLKQWEYQQSPGSRVFAVRSDGLMLCLTYLKEHDIWGWSRISTAGKFISVASTAGHMEDDLYTVVEREVNGQTKWYLERFMPRWDASLHRIEDAFYVDCGLSYENADFPIAQVGGLEHLEGFEVAILADGSPEPNQIVEGGQITLQRAANIIHIGLPYSSLFCPQTPDADAKSGSTLSRVRNYGRCTMSLLGSVCGKYGPSKDKLYDLPLLPDRYDSPVQPFSGFLEFMPNCAFSAEGEIWFGQSMPLPFTVAALMLDVDFQG